MRPSCSPTREGHRLNHALHAVLEEKKGSEKTPRSLESSELTTIINANETTKENPLINRFALPNIQSAN